MTTFSGVASNFAGVPLAFAFIATIGTAGLVTRWIEALTGADIHAGGFSIYNIWGLSIVYMYFQFPLMVLIMAPALDGLRREWREACENLGGTGGQYWRHIAFPILLPTLLETTILLFGNAFGAYATAYAFSGSFINLVTILIGAQMQGDVLYNPNLGYALALGMVLGNLIGAQIWECIRADIPDLSDQLRQGDFTPWCNWLHEKVQRHGNKYEPQQLIQRVTGSKIDPAPYMRYLEGKYRGIYSY